MSGKYEHLYSHKKLFFLLAAAMILSCQKEETQPSITFEGGSVPKPAFTKNGGQQTVPFTSARDWTATSSAAWLTLDKESGGEGENSFTITAAANDTYDERSATVTLKSASQSTSMVKTIFVTQAQAEALTASPSSFNVPYQGGDIEIKVTANVGYSISISGSWIVQLPATKALAESTVSFKVDPSWSTSARSAVISFTDGSSLLKASVDVHQDANPNPGSGEDTPFTMNCGEPGTYSSTGSGSPVRTLTFSDYQYAYGKDGSRTFLHYVDFEKEAFTMMVLTTPSIEVGRRCTLVTSCGDNGNMVEKNAESLLVVAKKEGKVWLEDKTTSTGYIIPEEQ